MGDFISKDFLSTVSQPDTCDRGMGDDVTRSYPPYVMMTHPMIKKTILCDTHTVGGGWIVIQVRRKREEEEEWIVI